MTRVAGIYGCLNEYANSRSDLGALHEGVYKNAFISARRFAVHLPHMFRNRYRGASNLALRRL
ncbi:MAG: hypothetical protein HXK63_04110 [Campylobacter sp.]|nr:hypothetical protein [Campylobacter sp.]